MDKYQMDESVFQAFCGTLQRTLRVADRNDEGNRRAMKKTKVAEKLDVDRSTVSAYLTEDGAGRVNLKLIDQLADLLGVPPAFLLMRRQDWVMLVSAFTHLAYLVSQNQGPAIFGPAGANPSRTLNPATSAVIGVHLASLMGVGPGSVMGRAPRETAALREAVEDRIATNCALPPYPKFSDEQASFVLALCALIGSRPKPI